MGPRLFSRGNFCSDGCRQQNIGASMGPRLFSRGNLENAKLLLKAAKGFNGAAAFQPRKLLGREAPGEQPPSASMGPRLFSRGNFPWRDFQC